MYRCGMKQAQRPWQGRQLGGRYHIEETLGTGGMARVFKAHDARLDRQVAVKILRTDVGYGEEYAHRLHLEARSLARLVHPHVVTIHDVGQADGLMYLVMELLRGDDLIDVVGKRGKLGLALVLEICAQVAAALAAAHAHGIVHRDIKPDNVFLVESVTGAYTKLLDFSFASLPVEMGGGRLSGERVVYGTAHYMSPEQASAQPCGPCADIYSLGVLLFELVAGHLPFDGRAEEVLAAHRNVPAPRLVEVTTKLPMGLSDLVEQMMHKKPSARPETALVVAQQLSAIRDAWLATLGRVAVQQARAGGRLGTVAATDHDLRELHEAEALSSGHTMEFARDDDWFTGATVDEGPEFATDTMVVEMPPEFDA